MTLTPTMNEFILHWGEMGGRWGVNRTVAQVHALLYLAPGPLTAEEIAETLSVARSNVSNSLRELQNWNLVQSSQQMGDRRDFFTTSTDVWALFQTVVEQRVAREILPTLAVLDRLAAEARTEKPAAPQVAARIAALQEFLRELHGWYAQVKTLPTGTLRKLIALGAGVTRWLPVARQPRGGR